MALILLILLQPAPQPPPHGGTMGSPQGCAGWAQPGLAPGQTEPAPHTPASQPTELFLAPRLVAVPNNAMPAGRALGLSPF